MELQTQTRNSGIQPAVVAATGRHVLLDGEAYYRIANSHSMAPFFTSLVSASDHWLFAASNGGVTMGRRSPSQAIFPYYSADKLIDLAHVSGPLTIFRITLNRGEGGGESLWEPFKDSNQSAGIYQNFYKNISGSKIQFEEVHSKLGLAFRYGWMTSERFGFVRTCCLTNLSDENVTIELLDGVQNIMPHGIDDSFQLRFSNLIDAYKKSELLPKIGLGIYYLSSVPTDHAEPSEGLRANVVWQVGLPNPTILLSSGQVAQFRKGASVQQESSIRGKRGSYLTRATIRLAAKEKIEWTLVANVGQDQTDVVNFAKSFSRDRILRELQTDVAGGENNLRRMVAAADGIQLGENQLKTHRHYSNVVYNLMRGGTPLAGYQIDVADFTRHVQETSRTAFDRHQSLWTRLDGQQIARAELLALAEATEDLDLIRITNEYLPLALSRRHGDPTRPWNSFSIDIKNSDGSPRLSYQGNWRDIFQNWEALGFAYPRLLPGMILRFINASTADGYNPYRLTKVGYDWERLDPADPWANIGYWGDHQVAYLGKLIEWMYRFSPSLMSDLLNRPLGVYAQIPYRIRPYDKILKDPYTTIDYDHGKARVLSQQTIELGADGHLLTDDESKLHRVCVLEKLMLPAIVKMTNLIPEAGIWLNTQRPEWNDANNALVGHGASVVTVCYLRRYFSFIEDLLVACKTDGFQLSTEIMNLIQDVDRILSRHEGLLNSGFSDQTRRTIVDELQSLSSSYREALYEGGLKGQFAVLKRDSIIAILERCVRYLDQTIESNQRIDGLYHSYNFVRFEPDGADGNAGSEPAVIRIEHLYEMLEGQVAVINSKKLSPEEVLDVLVALRNSSIYREDLQTYMLYPDRELPDFCDKNIIPSGEFENYELIRKLVEEDHQGIIRRDLKGELRFNGDFRNAKDLGLALKRLASSRPDLRAMIERESVGLEKLFRDTFHHHRFTGRSGTFFAYEGLGSVYWHMVSKLLLAVADVYVAARQTKVAPSVLEALKSHLREIRDALGTSSLPGKFGALPIDPYSHTPKHSGAQQPGMTGQVKEDLLSRAIEIGVRVDRGVIAFDPSMFETSELLQSETKFSSFDVKGQPFELTVAAGSFAFSFCQVPIIFTKSDVSQIRVFMHDSKEPIVHSGSELTRAESESIFDRDHRVERIEVLFS